MLEYSEFRVTFTGLHDCITRGHDEVSVSERGKQSMARSSNSNTGGGPIPTIPDFQSPVDRDGGSMQAICKQTRALSQRAGSPGASATALPGPVVKGDVPVR